jgi:hypothetical protein
MNFYTSQMRLSLAATVCTLLGAILILSACGEEQSATAERVASSTAAAPTARRSCRAQLRGFLGSLDGLREDLVVGLDYRSYLGEVREVRFAYEGIRTERLGLECLLAAGTMAERAFNLYIDAANAWGDCLTTASCKTSAVEPELQRRWARASDLITRAQRGLG